MFLGHGHPQLALTDVTAVVCVCICPINYFAQEPTPSYGITLVLTGDSQTCCTPASPPCVSLFTPTKVGLPVSHT